MKASIITIGNSKGIRIPQAILKQCQAEDDFEMVVHNDTILLKPIKKPNYSMSFDNLSNMSDHEIQALLKRIDVITLCISLISSDDETKNRVFKNLSTDLYKIVTSEIERLDALDAKSLIIEMHRAKINTVLSQID